MAIALLAGLILGAALGALLTQHSLHQRQQGLATMWLLQWHLDALQVAAKKQDCRAAQQAIAHLHVMADELAQVFPLANAQDVAFHDHITQLRRQTEQEIAPAGCTVGQSLQSIREACAGCHRDYR